jgi:hypothetical protein
MKIQFTLLVLIVTIGITTCNCSELKESNGSSDYFYYQDCPDFDNSKYISSLDFTFSTVPTAGVHCDLTITGVPAQNIYISYAEITASFNGI